eukprot:4520-Heterococcus_DN1.PRE.2
MVLKQYMYTHNRAVARYYSNNTKHSSTVSESVTLSLIYFVDPKLSLSVDPKLSLSAAPKLILSVAVAAVAAVV